jgi:hypothetical protein
VGSTYVVQPHESARECVGAERVEVFGLLADADEVDRQVECCLGDGDEHAALGRAVELGHDEAGDAGRIAGRSPPD